MYIYFILSGNAIKVGMTSDISNRLSNIQVANSDKIQVLHIIGPLNDMAECKKMESQIHEIFTRTHISGEWFHATQFMRDFISNIKENGWETQNQWLDEKYRSNYASILSSLKNSLEKDIKIGNLVSIDRIRNDFKELTDGRIRSNPSLTSLSEGIRTWISKRGAPFTIKDLYKHFGANTSRSRTNIRMTVKRLVDTKLIQRHKRSTYQKISV